MSDDFFDELDDLTPKSDPEEMTGNANGLAVSMTKLAALVEDLNRDLSTSSILDLAMDAAIELTGAERGFLVLLADNGELTFRVARNMETGNIEDARSAASQTVLRKVIAGGEPILINDVVGASDLTKQQSIAKMQVRSIMGAPLISKGKILGAAYVDTSKLAGVFDHTSLVLFQTFVQLAAVALQNARLIEAEHEASSRYREVQEYLDAVLVSQPHGVVILDKLLRVEYASPQASKLLSVAPMVRGHSFSELKFCDEDLELRLLGDMQEYLADGTARRATIQIGERTIAYSFFNVHKAGDRLDRVGLVLEDITAQKHLEQKLVESEKRSTVNQLAGGIAHEINNSLMPVKGRVELLQMRLKNNEVPVREALQKDLDMISMLSARIEKIVKNLRNLTRPAKPEFEPIDLRQLLLSTLDMLESTTGSLRGFVHDDPRAPYNLRVKVDDNIPLILGERHGLESAIINMIINSCHAIQEKGEGTLTICAHHQGDAVVVAVEDTGTGIPPEVLPRVFEPYFTTKAEDGGTGLGMSILQNIAEIHNAKLNLESRWGEGTRLSMTFPVSSTVKTHAHAK